ncbi:MAG: hypothetical protein AAB581_01490 [Patescibacteria group bacterium]
MTEFFNTLFPSKAVRVALMVIMALVIVFAAFKAGVIVGAKKAYFTDRWEKGYYQNFGGRSFDMPHHGLFDGFRDRDFMMASGVYGRVIKADSGSIVIRDRDDVEKIIVAGADTIVKHLRGSIALSDIHVDDTVVVIGEPNDVGQIVAKLIRLVPPLPAGAETATATPPFMRGMHWWR